ncbi:MAG: 4-hydroxy-tetrahydrodipicolinate reductase [Ruminococcus sp.]|nr:4-hydroxy-tetrahydrodipicolinate reductase [Ruminococcus sp.]
MEQVKILISGANGKMGHAVAAAIAGREDCVVCAGVDLYTKQYADFPIFEKLTDVSEKPDVVIDFSNPAILDDLLDYCQVNGVPCVLATTGYSEEQITKIRKAANSIPVFFSFNMSLGINLLVQLAKKAVSILGGQFDIEIVEKHHNQKIDAPSGTAIMLADAMNEELDNKYHYVYDRHSKRQKRDAKEIGMHAIRGGTIVGEHDIIFAGHDEVITLSHSAASKEVFAVGAVNAAVFLAKQDAGMYDMSQLMAQA